MDLIEIRSINGIEMNNNTYTEIFNAMDCDNDSTEFQMAFNGKLFTVILVFILWVCVAVQDQTNLTNK